MVIALSPALIMILIGSLVYFLLDIFYQGSYSGRVHFVLAAFIFAAVLIGRIAIELGSERAMMYAMPLALVTALALNHFLDVPLVAVILLIGLIWWSAHKLTIDCTLIDESQDSSGEGLLEQAGLVKRPPAQAPPAEPNRPPEGVTSREATQRPWWERLLNPAKRPHAPGVWIIYFSLVALPLFGLCQRFIPAADAARRLYAFQLTCVYCAAALGLLLTTSFLGLRRYLRQRRLQMPSAMAGSWLVIGCAMIVGLLGVAALLPRPGAEYAAAKLPTVIGSPDQKASPHGVGNQAAEEGTKGAPPGSRKPEEQGQDKAPAGAGDAPAKTEPEGKDSRGDQAKSPGGADEKPGPGGQKPSDRGGQGKSGEGKLGKEESGKGRSGKGDSGQTESRKGESGQEGRDKAKRGAGKPSRRDSSGDGARGTKGESPPKREESAAGAKQDRPEGKAQEPERSGARSGPPRPPPSAPRPPLDWLSQPMSVLLKWAFYGLVVVIGAYALWRSRKEVAGAFRQLLAACREFWAWLLGRKRPGAQAAAALEAPPPAPPVKRLADFVDPFAADTAERLSPDELVRYSFEALEAWGRETGAPRHPDQTAHEFAQQVGLLAEPLARDARLLADLYCRVAYAPGTLPRSSLRPLEAFWRNLPRVP
jgi:hypothetical protein